MRLSWNLSVGLASSAWTAILGVVATPFYLHFLGIESYGLIGFFTTLLTVLTLLDLGLSPTMNREVARCAAVGDDSGARHLLRSLEILYWAVAILLGGALLLGASWIGQHWLQSAKLAPEDITHAVMLMGLVLAVRWPIVLYASTLMGAQRLAVVGWLSILMVTAGALGAILILAFVSPSINAFFLWQAAISLVHAIFIRWASWSALGGRRGSTFQLDQIRRIWRFSAGLGLVTVTGIFLTQFDKVLLSRMIGLSAYGRYMLASLLASGLYLLVTPVFNVLYPRFSALVASGETERVAELYVVATRLLASLVFPIAVAVAFFSRPLVSLWTHEPAMAVQVAPILSLLIMGAALHGVMFLPYALQLAHGRVRLILAINFVLIAIYVPLMGALAYLYGQFGAAVAWLILHCIFLGFGSWITHRLLLKQMGARWLLKEVGIPLCSSLFVATAIKKIVVFDSDSVYEGVILALLVILGSFLLSLMLSPDLRKILIKNVVGRPNRT